MKKWLMSLTMGAMLVSLGQATTTEATFSSNAPTYQEPTMYKWSTLTQSTLLKLVTLEERQVIEQLYSQLMGVEFNTTTEKPVIQNTPKPVEQKPSDTTKTETTKPIAAKPVVETPKKVTQPEPKKPVAEKPVTPTKPVVEKSASSSTPEEQQSGSLSTIEQQVLTLTNQERAKSGLKPLASDAKLMNAAREKSTDMRKNNYFSHTSPTFGSPFDRMKALGITYKSAAENIAMGQKSADEVVNAWMNSPGHRQNIMNGNFTHIGIGYDAQGHYWTQQFIQK